MKKVKLKDFDWSHFGYLSKWDDRRYASRKIIEISNDLGYKLVCIVGEHRKRDIFLLSSIHENWVICKIAKIKRNKYMYFFRRYGYKGLNELPENVYQDFADLVAKELNDAKAVSGYHFGVGGKLYEIDYTIAPKISFLPKKG